MLKAFKSTVAALVMAGTVGFVAAPALANAKTTAPKPAVTKTVTKAAKVAKVAKVTKKVTKATKKVAKVAKTTKKVAKVTKKVAKATKKAASPKLMKNMAKKGAVKKK